VFVAGAVIQILICAFALCFRPTGSLSFVNSNHRFYALDDAGKMDKYRLVEEKFIGAQGFIDDTKDTVDVRAKGDIGEIGGCIVRITQQAKPRSCITTAMNMLVSVTRHCCNVSTGVSFCSILIILLHFRTPVFQNRQAGTSM